MNLRRITIVVSVSVAIVVVLYDIVPALTSASGDTVSEVIRDFSYRTSVIPFGMGVLIGHWFFPFRDRRLLSWLLCALLFLGVLYLDFFVGWTRPYVAVPAGVISGALLWGLNAVRD